AGVSVSDPSSSFAGAGHRDHRSYVRVDLRLHLREPFQQALTDIDTEITEHARRRSDSQDTGERICDSLTDVGDPADHRVPDILETVPQALQDVTSDVKQPGGRTAEHIEDSLWDRPQEGHH